MRLTGIRPGDVVEVDKRGFRFFARVTGSPNGTVPVEPLHAKGGNSYRSATSREVVGHYSRRAGSR